MVNHAVYVTPDGLRKLEEELEQLRTVKRAEVAQRLHEAMEGGELIENAEYEAAREAQALNEKRIMELENTLATSRLLDDEHMTNDEVLIGATVKLKDVSSGEELQYTLVAEEEADYAQGKISVSSPVGSGLLNHKEGEAVEIKVPAGTLRYTIVKISR